MGKAVKSVGKSLGGVAKAAFNPIGTVASMAGIKSPLVNPLGASLGGAAEGSINGALGIRPDSNGGGGGYNPGESMLSVADRYRPDYGTVRGADGQLQDQYKLKAGADVTANQGAVDAIRAKGMQQGPSAWAQMAGQQNDQSMMNQLNANSQSAATSAAQGMNSLAMRGGATSGSRERLLQSGANASMMANQQARNDANMGQYKIGMQDEQNKNTALGQAAGYDFQNAGLGMQNRDYQTGIQQKNIATGLEDQQGLNNYNMDTYKTRMAALGAERTANGQAQAARAGGGGKK